MPTSLPLSLAIVSQEEAVLRLLVVAALLAAFWTLAYRLLRITPARDDSMTTLEHAEEARRRILRMSIVLAFWFTFFITIRLEPIRLGGIWFAYPEWDVFGNTAARVYVWVAERTAPEGVTLVVTRPTEAVAAQMAIALFLAVAAALPIIAYETWAFFAPALRASERRIVLACVPTSVALFLGGAAFAFVYVVPLLLQILYSFAFNIQAEPLLSASALVGTVATMLTLFGIAFELPLVMTTLSALDVVKPATFLHKWRHATVAMVTVAALTTDPTLVSQLIVAACLLLLWWLGVAGAYAFHRPARQRAPEAALQAGS